MKINSDNSSYSEELDLGTRKVSKMNFSYIVTLPPFFMRSWPYGKIKMVKMTMLKDGSLKITPVKSGDVPAIGNL